jgi:hypothetical protein
MTQKKNDAGQAAGKISIQSTKQAANTPLQPLSNIQNSGKVSAISASSSKIAGSINKSNSNSPAKNLTANTKINNLTQKP